MKFFAHVGFQKTGSTFLQDCLFSCHPQIQYIGSVNKTYGSEDLRNLHRFLSIGEDIDDSGKTISEYFCSLTCDFDHSLPVVLSNEGLTGDHAIAVRLSRLYDDIRIIFVIREQLSSIESYYFGYATICINGTEGYPNYPLAFEEWYWKEREYFKVTRDYYKMIKIYSDVFGLDRIKVFLYEDLKNSSRQYIRDICEYVGVDAETGINIASG